MRDFIIVMTPIALTLWFLYSLSAIIYPWGLLVGRRDAVKSLVFSILLFVGSVFLIGLFVADVDNGGSLASTREPLANQIVEHEVEEAAVRLDGSSGADIPEPCGDGGLVVGDVVAVLGSYDLRVSAEETSQRIRNEKASRILGTEQFQLIDSSTTVRRLCVQESWTEVQIVTPDWLTEVRGWVPNEALRQIERTDDGTRIYVESDFYWDDDTTPYKPQIIEVVNRIARENRNCGEIDSSSVAQSLSRSKPNDPVFYVTCDSGVDVFNVWFKPGDAQAASSFAGTEPLSRNAAADACEVAAKLAATDPSTVEFSRVWDLAYLPHASGRAQIFSSFTAKNALGLELKYRISCLFDGAELIETQISESFD